MVRKAVIFKVLGLGQYFVLLYTTMHVFPEGKKKKTTQKHPPMHGENKYQRLKKKKTKV